MIIVSKKQRKDIAFLFEGIEDSMVKAYLQGHMGDAYIDSFPDPKYGFITSGEYIFFGGDPSDAKDMIRRLFDYIDKDATVAIYSDMKWKDLLLTVTENHPREVERYRIVQKNYVFDEKKLHGYIDSLPSKYTLARFNDHIYDLAMSAEWSKEFCETFASAEDYLKKGFGYAALYDGELVAGASTMTVYDGGEETQVATRYDHRGGGLAIACSAALLLECQRRGIRACWDAANSASKHIALKLGYEDGGVYSTVHMHR